MEPISLQWETLSCSSAVRTLPLPSLICPSYVYFPIEPAHILYFQLNPLIPSSTALCNSDDGSHSHSFVSDAALVPHSFSSLTFECLTPSRTIVFFFPLFASDFSFLETSNGALLIKCTTTAGRAPLAALPEPSLYLWLYKQMLNFHRHWLLHSVSNRGFKTKWHQGSDSKRSDKDWPGRN